MQTKVFKLDEKNRDSVLFEAAEIIKKGGLVVFPTETVYGLGANALDDKAVSKIFTAKGRPSDNPIIVHIASRDQLFELTENISLLQEKLMEVFWPGPLTIIFEKKNSVSKILSGGLSTVAVRMPAHPFARELVKLSDTPIAAPSANISGRPSATTGEHAYQDLLGKVDIIVDAGFSDIGVESTVVSVEGDRILILRPGIITEEILLGATGAEIVFAKDKESLAQSPGTRYKHYAPKAKMILVAQDKMSSLAREELKAEKKVGVLCVKESLKDFKNFENVFVLGSKNNPEEILKNLYAGLRYFDDKDVEIIIAPTFPKDGVGEAIMDRLEKASAVV